MQADSDDRYTQEPTRGKRYLLPAALLALLLIAGIAWFFNSDEAGRTAETPAAGITPSAVTSAKPEIRRPPAPDIPERQLAPETTAALVDGPAEPPLTLEGSDTAVRDTLSLPLSGTVVADVLEESSLLERSAAFLDAASNGAVLRDVFPLPRPAGDFAVTQSNGQTVIDPRSYARYDPYAKAFAAVDTGTLVTTFHRFRPLLEQAYANLGFPAERLDNALIGALDEVIAVPQLGAPAALVAGIESYTYQDPTLEQLSPMARQLLRMGPENQALIQEKARDLRSALLAP